MASAVDIGGDALSLLQRPTSMSVAAGDARVAQVIVDHQPNIGFALYSVVRKGNSSCACHNVGR